MTTIARNQVAPVALPSAEVELPSIGGTVLVRGLDLPGVLKFAAARRRALVPVDGETEQDASERAVAELLPMLLHMTVVLDDGLPVYSPGEWAAYAGKHPGDAMQLWQRSIELSGQDAAAEKKT